MIALCLRSVNALPLNKEATAHITQEHLRRDFYGLFKISKDQIDLNAIKRNYKKMSLR